MARLVGKLTLETKGLDQCRRSLESIGEAAQNAYFDIEGVDLVDGVLAFKGMPITRIETFCEGFDCVFSIKATGAMVIFIGWLMANLPRTASVNWVDGWPIVRCPPNDDCDYDDDPTPLTPDELELA